LFVVFGAAVTVARPVLFFRRRSFLSLLASLFDAVLNKLNHKSNVDVMEFINRLGESLGTGWVVHRAKVLLNVGKKPHVA
jgi:hypothetical protein